MPYVRIRPAARRDLLAIGRYTARTWGTAQRTRYLRELEARLEALAAEPALGVPRDDLRPGYRCGRQGRHLIFYRPFDDGIEVVRILHERMDVHRHLPALAPVARGRGPR